MISTSITGGAASNQLFDLLAVVANPDAFKSKLEELEAATVENKKYVEALGPASEIIQLREQAQALRVDAQAYADSVIAQAAANALISKAQDELASAQAARAEVAQLRIDADSVQKAAVIAINTANQREAAAAAAEKAAQVAKDIADESKANILAKHKAFIESL